MAADECASAWTGPRCLSRAVTSRCASSARLASPSARSAKRYERRAKGGRVPLNAERAWVLTLSSLLGQQLELPVLVDLYLFGFSFRKACSENSREEKRQKLQAIN